MLLRFSHPSTPITPPLSLSMCLMTETGINFLRSVRLLLVTANVVPSSPILVPLMMKALSSSETSVLTRVTRRNIREDGILHSHRRENLKSYIVWVDGFHTSIWLRLCKGLAQCHSYRLFAYSWALRSSVTHGFPCGRRPFLFVICFLTSISSFHVHVNHYSCFF
jgi:hypothetical protein